MLYQTDRWPLDDKTVEKMLEPLPEACRDAVRAARLSIIQGLQTRNDYKGLGQAEMYIATFDDTPIGLAGRAILRWLLESDGFQTHMEVSQSSTQELLYTGGDGKSYVTKLQVVLLW